MSIQNDQKTLVAILAKDPDLLHALVSNMKTQDSSKLVNAAEKIADRSSSKAATMLYSLNPSSVEKYVSENAQDITSSL